MYYQWIRHQLAARSLMKTAEAHSGVSMKQDDVVHRVCIIVGVSSTREISFLEGKPNFYPLTSCMLQDFYAHF